MIDRDRWLSITERERRGSGEQHSRAAAAAFLPKQKQKLVIKYHN